MSTSLMKSSAVVGGMTLISRVLGFVRDILFAAAFGAGAGMDAFLVALKIPNFGRRMFAEGAFAQSFVPVFTETRTRGTHEDVSDLLSRVSGTLGGVLGAITLVGCLASPLLMGLFAPGFADDPAQFALGADMLRWTFPYLMFISLTAMAGGVLNSYGQFAVPAITPVILNICLIAAAFIDNDSVQVLAYAVFAAGILQLAAQLPSLRRLNLTPRPRWGWGDAKVQRIMKLMVPIMIGSSVAQVSLLLDTIIASFLVTGSVSWLYFADRLMEFPLGLFSIAIGTVILPTLSAQFASQSDTAFSDTLDWALKLLLLVGLPAALGLFVLAGPLVVTLFQYRAFTATDVHMTAAALMAYAFGFMGFSLVKILVPGFYARQETRVPVRFAITALLCGMALSVTGVLVALHFEFGAPHAVLAAATSTSAWINALLLFGRLRRDGVYVPVAAPWKTFGLRLLLANLAMVTVVVVLQGPLQLWLDLPLLDRVLRLLWVLAAAGLSYGAMLFLTGLRPHHLHRRSR
jgi:putative peptidoglycan lipid II flippase